MTQDFKATALWKRYGLWAKTRYPAKNWIFSSLVYFTIAFFVKCSSNIGSLSWIDLINSFAVGCFFLLLRIYDEHKDYEIDLKFHPERPVAKGVVSLKELRYLFAAALVLQLVLNFTLDQGTGAASMAWAVAFVWSLLMAKEFFLGEFLQKRLLLYAISHMLIMLPLAYWIIFMADPDFAVSDPRAMVLALLVFLTGAIGEVARKTRSPQDEIEGVDSYSSLLGVGGVLSLLLLLDIVYLVSLAYLLLGTSSSLVQQWLCIALAGSSFVVAMIQGGRFYFELHDNQGKQVEDSQGLLILLSFLSLALVYAF